MVLSQPLLLKLFNFLWINLRYVRYIIFRKMDSGSIILSFRRSACKHLCCIDNCTFITHSMGKNLLIWKYLENFRKYLENFRKLEFLLKQVFMGNTYHLLSCWKFCFILLQLCTRNCCKNNFFFYTKQYFSMLLLCH